MLKLTNIKKINNTIEANYVPEDSKEVGYLIVDLETQEITQEELTSHDGMRTYVSMARNKLLTLSKETEIPSEALSMWY